MRLLLDIHTFLWTTGMPAELSSDARSAIEDLANDVYVSAAVAWEIAIKHGRGKLVLPRASAAFMTSRLRASGFRALPITHDHALAAAGLPAIHADPFDRIMIAPAQFEGLTLVTRDPPSLRYPVSKIEG